MAKGSLVAMIVLAIGFGSAGSALAHPEPNDIDGDNVVNAADNCVSVYNVDQADADADGAGNRCDPDYDQDGDRIPNGYPNRVDNCPTVANANQADTNGDGVGDACAIDTDGDTIFDFEDNCPSVDNRFQNNLDADDLGDVCDPDVDGDDPDTALDLRNETDNCPTVYNPDQRDDDRDGTGALCDADDVPPPAGPAMPGGDRPAPGGGTTGPPDRLRPSVTVGLARIQRFETIRDGLVVPLRRRRAGLRAAQRRRRG